MTRIMFPDPFEVQNADGDFPAVLLVEHARNAIPDALNGLGLDTASLGTHIAWDIGIEGVSRQVSDRLAVPAVYCLYSRLIVDANRLAGDRELFWTESDGIAVPGNARLGDEEKEARLSGIYNPYHEAAARVVSEAMRRHGNGPSIIGMHSCTRQLRGGDPRPWHIGLSTYDSDGLMEECRAALEGFGFDVGAHQPYDIRRHAGVSLDRHGRGRGLPHLLIEIRQDLIADVAGQREWADVLVSVFRGVLRDGPPPA